MMTRDMNVKNVGKRLFAMTIWQNTKKYIQVGIFFGSWLKNYYFEINKKLMMDFFFSACNVLGLIKVRAVLFKVC